MREKKYTVILFLFILLTCINAEIIKNKENRDKYFDSLLSIESAKKLYRKMHYESALSKLLNIAGTIKNKKIKAAAILEISYVKFLMGYSLHTYEIFIKKALDFSNNSELNNTYKKEFVKQFNIIKRTYTPHITHSKKNKKRIIVRPNTKTVQDMEIKKNLIFKLKKKIISLEDSNRVAKQEIALNKKLIISLKKKNKEQRILINKLSIKINALNKSKEKNYKKKYLKLKNENIHLKKEEKKKISEKEKIISELNTKIKKKELEIKELKSKTKIKIEQDKNKMNNKSSKKRNVFKTLQLIWINNKFK